MRGKPIIAERKRIAPHAYNWIEGQTWDELRWFGSLRIMAEPCKAEGTTKRRMRLRAASAEDFEELWKIDQESFEPGIAYSRGELASYMRRATAFTLVAETERDARAAKVLPKADSIVGFVVGQLLNRGIGHIITIDIRPAAQRLGVGTALLEAAEEQIRTGGGHSIFLEVAVDNEGAIRFYKKRGYSTVRTLPRYYMGEVDGLLMAKRLP